MNKILTMAGAVVAIVVLAASFAPSAEAMMVTAKDSGKGIKVRCGVTQQHTVKCDFQSKFGIEQVNVLDPLGGFEQVNSNCNAPVRTESTLTGGEVDYFYTVIDCSGAIVEVDVHLVDKQITAIFIS